VHGGTRAALAADGHVPRNACTLRRTTSMPTPRPERSLMAAAVEKPGSNISWKSSRSAIFSGSSASSFFWRLRRRAHGPIPRRRRLLDDDAGALMDGSHSHGSGRRLTLFLALSRPVQFRGRWHCESYVKWIFKMLDDRSVDFDVFAFDHQTCQLAVRFCDGLERCGRIAGTAVPSEPCALSTRFPEARVK